MFKLRNHSLLSSFSRTSSDKLENLCKTEGLHQRFANYTRENIVAYFSASVVGISPGAEILIPNFMCSVLLDALLSLHLKPICYTVSVAKDLQFEEAEILAKITPATRAVFFVDYFGVLMDPSPQLLAQLRDKNILVLKDAAHSFLSHFHRDFASLKDYDATFFSLYKLVPIPLGAQVISRIPLEASGISPLPFFRQLLVLLIKPLLLSLFPRLRGWALRDLTIVVSKRMDPQTLPKGRFWKRVRGLGRFIAYEKLLHLRMLHTEKCLRLFSQSSGGVCRPLFGQELLRNSGLLAFPLLFDSKNARDAVYEHLLKDQYDAYTWPVFAENFVNEENWSRLLLLPLSCDPSEALRKALEEVATMHFNRSKSPHQICSLMEASREQRRL